MPGLHAGATAHNVPKVATKKVHYRTYIEDVKNLRTELEHSFATTYLVESEADMLALDTTSTNPARLNKGDVCVVKDTNSSWKHVTGKNDSIDDWQELYAKKPPSRVLPFDHTVIHGIDFSQNISYEDYEQPFKQDYHFAIDLDHTPSPGTTVLVNFTTDPSALGLVRDGEITWGPEFRNLPKMDYNTKYHLALECKAVDEIWVHVIGFNTIHTPFVTTWVTRAADTDITLPIVGFTNLRIDWGDGHPITDITSNHPSHTYKNPGVHNISILGDSIAWSQSGAGGDAESIIDIRSWGDVEFTNCDGMFQGCTNLLVSATDIPKIIGNSVASMFEGCSVLHSIVVSSWDLSTVTDTRYMFKDCTSLPYIAVGKWDVSNVTTMEAMFDNCQSLDTLHTEIWDVANVTNMSYMFNNTKVLDMINLANWDISNVMNMTDMFSASNSPNTAHYGDMLIAWSKLHVQSGVPFHAGTAQYPAAAQNAVDILVSKGWTITDGGIA